MSLGVIFIVIGVLMVLKAIFPISIPIGKIVMAGFFIYLGITMLVPSWSFKNHDHDEKAQDEDSVVFGDSTIRPTSINGAHREFNVVFGRGTIDLTQLKLDRQTDIHVNAVFGSAEVELNPKTPVAFDITSVLGATSVPEKSSAQPDATAPTLNLKLNSVFGHIRVVNK